MMKTIRDHAHSVFAKILLVLLVLSFGIWGIGDIFRQGGGAVNVAKAGSVSISLQEYQRALRMRAEQMRQAMGSAYSPEALKRMGLGIHVLFSLVNDALIGQEAAAVGIRVSDDEVRSAIARTPGFTDKNGGFDKAAYQETLRQNGVSEARYVDDVRKDIAARLLSETVTASVPVSEAMVQLLYRVRQEKRTADIFLVPANAMTQVPEPTDKDVAAYYAEHKDDFIAPEYRTFSVISLPLKDLEARTKPSAEDIGRVYEEHRQDFHMPERRVVEQLVFHHEADAQAASARLAKGNAFDEVAKSPTVTNKDKISMGEITRAGAPADADAVFALKAGQSTKPVQSAFGWHIFHVSKIEPEGIETLAEATPQISHDLAEKQAQDTIGKQVTDLEDALAGGATPAKAAAQLGGKLGTFGPVTQQGISPDGKPATLPDYDNLLKIVFQTGEKQNAPMAQASDGSYFLVHVDGVTPAQARPLAEVRQAVIAAWKEQDARHMLRDAMEAADKDMQAGKAPAAALVAHGIAPIAPVKVAGLKRGDAQISTGALAGKPLPQALLGELFGLAPHQSTHAVPLPDGSYMVATLDQVTGAPQPPEPKALQALRDELKDTLANDMLQDYLGYLRGKYPVTVNQSALGAKDDGEGE